MYDKLINNKIFLWLILLSAIVIISAPLYIGSGPIYGDDTLFHLNRIEGIRQGLSNGEFPVKLYGYFFNDYGYPAGYFYPDLFLYIPALLGLATGGDTLFAYHSFLFLINILTAVISLISFNKLFREIKIEGEIPYYVYGFTATVLYLGAWYRLLNVYVRVALGEAIAMSFLPLALISFYLMLKGSKKAWIGVVIGATGILESHILSSLLLFAAYILMSVIFFRKFFDSEVLKSILKASIFTVMLNVWFYAPFLSMYDSMDFFMKSDLNQLKILDWNGLYAYQFTIGFVSIPALLFYLICCTVKKRILKSDKIFVICLILVVAMISTVSPLSIWKLADCIPFLSEKLSVFQFAYRISSYTAILATIALTIVVCKKKKFLITSLIIVFANIFSLMYIPMYTDLYMLVIRKDKTVIADVCFPLKGSTLGDTPLSSLDIMHNPNWSIYKDYLYDDLEAKEYMESLDFIGVEYWEAVKMKKILNLDPYDITPKESVTNFSRNGLHLSFTTNPTEPTDIKLPLWYYPHSYGATCDGKELPVFEVYHHRLAITAPKGEHNIQIFPKLHTPHKNACILSFLSLIVFIAICVSTLKER